MGFYSLNPNFFIESLEGYVSAGIDPKSIIATHSHNQFVESPTVDFKSGQNDA